MYKTFSSILSCTQIVTHTDSYTYTLGEGIRRRRKDKIVKKKTLVNSLSNSFISSLPGTICVVQLFN